jgi:hypothetical protein
MALYDAFISYSHARDKPIAAALQSVVQKLGKPWYRRRALRVFRDDTSLSATPHLWPTIEHALSHARYFILLASPEAADSKWVNKEVAYWLDHNSSETLLIGTRMAKLLGMKKPMTFDGVTDHRCRRRSSAAFQRSRNGSTYEPTGTAPMRAMVARGNDEKGTNRPQADVYIVYSSRNVAA